MATYYAWSPIDAGDKSAKAGDTVTAQGLGLSKEEFDELVDSGAVREEKYPKIPEGYTGSVSEFQATVAAAVDSEEDNGPSKP